LTTFDIGEMHEGKETKKVANFDDIDDALNYMRWQLVKNAPNNQLSIVKRE